jgi:hypothetical protein
MSIKIHSRQTKSLEKASKSSELPADRGPAIIAGTLFKRRPLFSRSAIRTAALIPQLALPG